VLAADGYVNDIIALLKPRSPALRSTRDFKVRPAMWGLARRIVSRVLTLTAVRRNLPAWTPEAEETLDTARVGNMHRFQTVDLSACNLRVGTVKFLRAEVPREPAPFALIRYSVRDEEQPLGLRLDMDKRVFLDQLATQDTNGALQNAAPAVADAILEALPH
jgi:hypothetical protein